MHVQIWQGIRTGDPCLWKQILSETLNLNLPCRLELLFMPIKTVWIFVRLKSLGFKWLASCMSKCHPL